jgi:hypothetical protein
MTAAIGAAVYAKHHRRKGGFVFAFMGALILSVAALSATAYAKYSPDDYEPYPAEITITIPALEETEAGEEPDEPQTLTPDGNLTLVDDFSVDNDHDMQFITVITRNGHFFYIVIDRSTDRFNVHFLNQVDEYDLWAILDEDAPRPVPLPEYIPEPEPEPEEEPETEQGGGIGGIIILLVLIGAVGGGAYYYFKVLKPGQAAKNADVSQIDEFVFDDDEDEYGNHTGVYDGGVYGDDDMPDFSAKPENSDSDQDGEDALSFKQAELSDGTQESGDK